MILTALLLEGLDDVFHDLDSALVFVLLEEREKTAFLRVRAHSTCVGPLIPLECSFVVLHRGHRNDLPAVAERLYRELLPDELLLYHYSRGASYLLRELLVCIC